MTWTLIIDTAEEELRVGLGEETLQWQEIVPPAPPRHRPRHGSLLAPLVAQGLQACGIPPSRLGRIGVVRGPGSFTGLRIGLSFVQGLALALKIPVAAPLLLQVKAWAAMEKGQGKGGRLLLFQPAGRGKGFFALYDYPGAHPVNQGVEEGTLEEARAKAKLEKAEFFTDPQEGEDLL
ncbi:MAG: tRNA (adenosine(37)-N6)-threonylcarbamoyltransferase complex dimerization subunit type 1 TsaB, partial [Bacillota bacterium]|nr:tRNA (adenosine(37)-N6)-threonylcarbamoyltransferase complex dimerization subunit type 1 TsaB [Bacillota bacterium]